MNKIDVRNLEFGEKVFADLNTVSRAVEDDSIAFTMSDEVVDRHGTIVKLDRIALDNYKKNPIILWMHQSSSRDGSDYNEDNILGYGEPYFEDGKIKVKIHFEGLETTGNVRAEKIRKKIEFGSLRMGSIGFIPQSGSFGEKDKGEDEDIFYIREWELLEYSIVAIPSNPNASVEGLEKEIVLEPAPELDKLLEEKKVEKASFLQRAKYKLRLLNLKK